MAIIRPPIYKGQVLEAAKSFRCANRNFKAGDVFPYERMSIAWRRVRQMYDCGRVQPVLKDKKIQKTLPTKDMKSEGAVAAETATKPKKLRKKVARERKGG